LYFLIPYFLFPARLCLSGGLILTFFCSTFKPPRLCPE
jgi:hypothetical protein